MSDMTTPNYGAPSPQHCDQEEVVATQEEQQTTTLTAQYVQCARMQFHTYCQQHPSLRQALAQLPIIAHKTTEGMTAASALVLLQEHPRWTAMYPLDRHATCSPSSSSLTFCNRETVLDLVRKHMELYLVEEVGKHWQEERV
jgi:hypothetical protein